MRDIKNSVWLGVWLIILPFLGIPSAWKEWLVALTGVAVLAVSFVRFRRNGPAPASQREALTHTYRENREKPVTADNDPNPPRRTGQGSV